MGPRAAYEHLRALFDDLQPLTPGPGQAIAEQVTLGGRIPRRCVLTRSRAHWVHVSVACWPLDDHELVHVRRIGPRTLPSFPLTIHVEHSGPLQGWACVGVAVPVLDGQIPWSLVYAALHRLCSHADTLDADTALARACEPVIDDAAVTRTMDALSALEEHWAEDATGALQHVIGSLGLPTPAYEELRASATPALALQDCATAQATGHLGGAPPLPDGVSWPHAEGVPLPFLGVVGLAGRPQIDGEDLLPTDGYLLFFAGERPHGEVACRVLYCPALGAPRTGPAFYRARPIQLLARPSIPAHWAALPATTVALDDDQESEELVAEVLDTCADLLGPHLLGCAPRSGSYVRDALLDPRWTVLAQFPSDPVSGMHFGDAGTLTVAVPSEDLRAGRFDRAVARQSD